MATETKKTMVLGASNNPSRYSYKCVHRLQDFGHEVVPIGIKRGEVGGIPIINEKKPIENVDTVSMYLSAANQKEYYTYLLEVISPKRIIFNPGAENEDLASIAQQKGIEVEEACTLVMLSTGQF